MKAFSIFPAIAGFIIAFAIFKERINLGTGINLVWSTATALLCGGIYIAGLVWSDLTWILILSHALFACILVPVITFLLDGILPSTPGLHRWIRLFGTGLIALFITVVLFAASTVFALVNNPMDPGMH